MTDYDYWPEDGELVEPLNPYNPRFAENVAAVIDAEMRNAFGGLLGRFPILTEPAGPDPDAVAAMQQENRGMLKAAALLERLGVPADQHNAVIDRANAVYREEAERYGGDESVAEAALMLAATEHQAAAGGRAEQDRILQRLQEDFGPFDAAKVSERARELMAAGDASPVAAAMALRDAAAEATGRELVDELDLADRVSFANGQVAHLTAQPPRERQFTDVVGNELDLADAISAAQPDPAMTPATPTSEGD